MKITKLFLLLASTSALVISSAGSALAASTSAGDNLHVTATVVKSCTIVAHEVAFGEYNPLGGVLNGTGSVVVTCSKGSGTSVALDYGQTPDPLDSTQPRMKNGTSYLKYKLFSDSDHSKAWNGTSVDITPAGDTLTPQTLTVYGQVAGSQNVTPGDYLDIVVATVNF
jgi:spore coat protein U-like protein